MKMSLDTISKLSTFSRNMSSGLSNMNISSQNHIKALRLPISITKRSSYQHEAFLGTLEHPYLHKTGINQPFKNRNKLYSSELNLCARRCYHSLSSSATSRQLNTNAGRGHFCYNPVKHWTLAVAPYREFCSGRLCWKCDAPLKVGEDQLATNLLVCSACGSPQKVVGVPNYFQLLGHPVSFRLDDQLVSNRAKELQRKLHPDLFAQHDQEVQDLSQQLSSLVNKAVSTLLNPIERGRYLLQLNGIADPISDVEKEITNDPEFLEDMMSLNETLEELDSEESWRRFRAQNQENLEKFSTELHNAFEAKDIRLAKVVLGRMKYYDTLQEKLKEMKGKLEIVE